MSDFNPGLIKIPQELEGRMFFTTKEFGALVGKSSSTVSRWYREGWLKMAKFSPRCRMVPKSELDRFLRGEMMEPDNKKADSVVETHV